VARSERREYEKAWRQANPEKVREYAKRWRKNNPEITRVKQRRNSLKRQYGMSPQDYDALFAAQGGRCAICGTDKLTGRWSVFAVDHCHITNKVRGLLCNECNRGMGLMKDDPARLLAAVDYLNKHREVNHESLAVKEPS
jgi:hypothetical protein